MVTDRRDFLAALAAGLGIGVPGRPTSVSAIPTVFYRQPDGRMALVRFRVTDVTAPAGRLRVFDGRNQLIGTAGLLPRPRGLAGELWLPLDGATRIRSELEMPGTRRPIRTGHDLVPRPRWTVYWFTAAGPELLQRAFDGLPFWMRGASAAVMAAAGVRANPVSAGPHTDQLDVLRTAVPAARLERDLALPMGRAAVLPLHADPLQFELALRGSGVESVLRVEDVGNAALLGFGENVNEMSGGIESWLSSLVPGAEPVAMAVGADPFTAVRWRAAVDEWNRRYAYPHIVIGEPPAGRAIPTSAGGPQVPVAAEPGADALRRITRRREVRADRAATRFGPLALLVAPGDPSLDGIAERFSFPVAGTLVFNSAPFGRSDVVRMPDGHPRVVTDVPGLGYAFIPDDGVPPPPPIALAEAWHPLEGAGLRVAMNPGSGALVTLREGAGGAELLDGPSNTVAGDRVESVARQRLPGIGERLEIHRDTAVGLVVTTLTSYESLPWLDIVNDGHGRDTVTYSFALGRDAREMSWDVPGGMRRAPAPADGAPLRWLAVHLTAGSLIFGIPDMVRATLDDAGNLTFTAPPGPTGIRVTYRGFLMQDDPWRVGWSMEPMMALPTPGTGTVTMPTFGRMLDIRDPGILIEGIKMADDGVGAILYLHDLLGIGRDVAVAPGLVRFDRAFETDFAERDRETLRVAADGTLFVRVPENGFAALRLLGLRRAG